ncbi:hypothetical protein HK101_007278 [Irineochytrium annulatum]|nr:hypothetical protein HK101_007278 [Irineochytrium annulatum]
MPSGGPPSGGGAPGGVGRSCSYSNSTAVNATLQTACAALKGMAIPASSIGLASTGALITNATLIPASQACSGVEYCQVNGVITPVNASFSVNGMPIPTPNITFEIGLPSNWTGRILQQGGGGFDGSVPGVDNDNLGLGFAQYGSDSGHSTAAQLLNDEALQNFGKLQIKKAHDVMAAVVKTYYGVPHKFSYFMGGSQGGHEALIAAEDYGDDYDGVVCGFPAYDLYVMHPGALDLIKTLYNARTAGTDGYKYTAAAGAGWMSGNLTTAFQVAITNACDALDGAADGVVVNPGDPTCVAFKNSILMHNSSNPLRCPDGAATDPHTCMSDPQIETMARFASRYYNPTGITLDAGLVSYAHWPFIEGARLDAMSGFGTNGTSYDVGQLGIVQTQLQIISQNLSLTTADVLAFDLSQYKSRIAYLSSIIDTADVSFTTFRRRGGKLIHYVGSNDVSIAAFNSVDLYMRITGQFNAASGYLGNNAFFGFDDAAMNSHVVQNAINDVKINATTGLVDDFYSFYLIPGYGHGQGYYDADVDWMGAITDWVELGVEPADRLVSNDTSNGLGTRPLCHFPLYPKFVGTGAITDHTQYACAKLDMFAKAVGEATTLTSAPAGGGARGVATSARQWLQASNGADRFVKVPGRGVVEIEGPDAVKFLQGLMTNQMTKIERGGDGILAFFLSAQGRVLFDAFVFPKNMGSEFPRPSFLIEVDSTALDAFVAHLGKYKLRSKITATDVSAQYQLYQAWGPRAPSLWKNYLEPVSAKKVPVGGLVPKERFADIGCKDPRHPEMGVRFLITNDAKFPLPSTFTTEDPSHYTLRRTILGIPEGHLDLFHNQSLPLESNLDYMSGVDFRKGCYLGQELTIRTYHTGVTRKRIVPVQLLKENESPGDELQVDVDVDSSLLPASGSEIRLEGVAGKKGEAGRFGSGIHNIGLALMRLDHVASPTLMAANGARVKPAIPTWWPRLEVDQ